MFQHPSVSIGGQQLSPVSLDALEPLEPPVPEAGEFRDPSRYVVRHLVGAGGLGVVYAVDDRLRDQTVALKTLRRLDPDSIYQLKREFRNLADVAHPNLVTFHDLCIDDDHCFFTMELVDGDTFVDYVRRPEGDREDRLRRALPQLIAGVEELHRRGIQHRDLKPSNVLVNGDGRVIILDFGLTSPLLAETAGRGELAGTPAYLAPEQCLGVAGTHASDWYAVGATMYHALTGTTPFTGTIRDVIQRKTTEDPPHVLQAAPDAPPLRNPSRESSRRSAFDLPDSTL
jgi:serine/threonine protein kinase